MHNQIKGNGLNSNTLQWQQRPKKKNTEQCTTWIGKPLSVTKNKFLYWRNCWNLNYAKLIIGWLNQYASYAMHCGTIFIADGSLDSLFKSGEVIFEPFTNM